jgi:hypothetical protein
MKLMSPVAMRVGAKVVATRASAANRCDQV